MKLAALIPLAALLAAGTAMARPASTAGAITGASASPPATAEGRLFGVPPDKIVGAIRYTSGGVGISQSRAFEKAAAGYPLELEFVRTAKPRDEFTAGVSVSILNNQGKTLLSTTSDGPFLLARLPPGEYRVRATDHGRTIVRRITVAAHHHEREVFAWPA